MIVGATELIVSIGTGAPARIDSSKKMNCSIAVAALAAVLLGPADARPSRPSPSASRSAAGTGPMPSPRARARLDLGREQLGVVVPQLVTQLGRAPASGRCTWAVLPLIARRTRRLRTLCDCPAPPAVKLPPTPARFGASEGRSGDVHAPRNEPGNDESSERVQGNPDRLARGRRWRGSTMRRLARTSAAILVTVIAMVAAPQVAGRAHAVPGPVHLRGEHRRGRARARNPAARLERLVLQAERRAPATRSCSSTGCSPT